MRSVLSALNLTAIALAAYLCSFFLLLTDVTTRSMGHQWITDNLNEGHLDLFYLVILGSFSTRPFLTSHVTCAFLVMMVLVLCWFVYEARRYEYKNAMTTSVNDTELELFREPLSLDDDHPSSSPL